MSLLKGAEASVLLHLRRGASVNARDERGRTPLMMAASCGRTEICRLLIAEGASSEASDAEGRTALEHALAGGFPDLAALFLPATSAPRPAAPKPVEPGADDGPGADAWTADEAPTISASDETLSASVVAVQVDITRHRFVQAADDWSTAEISLPVAARSASALPPGARRLFRSALAAGWTTDGLILRELGRADVFTRRQARAVLERAGVVVEREGRWTRRVRLKGAGRVDPDELEEALELLESLLDDRADLFDRWLKTTAAHPAPDRDEEGRLFERLAEAREAVIFAVRTGLTEMAAWLSCPPQGLPDNEAEDEDIEPSTGGEDEIRILLSAIQSGQLGEMTLPYAALVRLLEGLDETVASGPAAQALNRALERFRTVRDRIVHANLRLVTWVARRYGRRGFPMPDLVQEGHFGLMRAIEKFDVARGGRFSTYAVWWIRQSISRFIDDHAHTVRIPVHAVEAMRKVNRARTAHQMETGLWLSPLAVSERTGVQASLVERLDEALVTRLDGVVLDREKCMPAMTDHAVGHPHHTALQADRRRVLSRVLGQLTPREERVLRMRFGLELASDMTLEEVGSQFDVTRERIRQIEAKALRKLRFPSRLRELRSI